MGLCSGCFGRGGIWGKTKINNILLGITLAFISTFIVTEHEKKETMKQACNSE